MKRILLFICLTTTFFVHAQSNEVTLVVSGEGANKTDATAMALRSAIEQAFGTFVSANTEILNDEIVKDEIATVSSGNIKSYKEISATQTSNGYNVTVQAVVSIGKLIEYSKLHGSTVDYAGQIFAMNIKMKQLNKKNEAVALDNLLKELTEISKNMFDLSINTNSNPCKVTCDIYENGTISNKCNRQSVNVTIKYKSNETTKLFYTALCNTLSALSLTNNEIEDYNNTNDEYYTIAIVDLPEYHSGGTSADWYSIGQRPLVINLRNSPEKFVEQLGIVIHDAIYDNTKLDLNGCGMSYSYKKTEYEYTFFPAQGYGWEMKPKNYLVCPINETIKRENYFGNEELCYLTSSKIAYNGEKPFSLTLCQTDRNDIIIVPWYKRPIAGEVFRSQWNLYYVKQNYYDRERIPQESQQKWDARKRELIFIIDNFHSFSYCGVDLFELCFDIPIKEEDLMNLTGFSVYRNGQRPIPSNTSSPNYSSRSQIANDPLTNNNTNNDQKKQGEVFQIVEEMPSFPEGNQKLNVFLKENVRSFTNTEHYIVEKSETTESLLQRLNVNTNDFRNLYFSVGSRVFEGQEVILPPSFGDVIVSFIVETDGSLSDFKIVKSLRDKYDEEALRVLKAMPRWNPGKQRGRPVRVSYTLRISFTSNNQ